MPMKTEVITALLTGLWSFEIQCHVLQMETVIKEIEIIFSVKTDTVDHWNVSFIHQTIWRHISS
jgi:hypothetical protein